MSSTDSGPSSRVTRTARTRRNLVTLIAVEIIVGTSGIGFMMFDARRAGSTVEIILGMIVLGTLWYIVDAWILAPIERATGRRWGLVTS